MVCTFLLMNIPKDRIQDYNEIKSIDEAVEILDKSLHSIPPRHYKISPEEEFSAHWYLTAINQFGDEIFSEGLDRAKYGEYTVLMKSVDPFLVCYLFKGQLFLAKQKLAYFAD